ncbi:hypothetical protein N325_12285, partial [Colius striatus]
KGQSPSPTKSKVEQPEDLRDDAEGRCDSSVCYLMNNFSFISLVPADETKPPAVASLSSSEETELSQDKDSLKESKGAGAGDPMHPVGCEQDRAEGQEDVSAEEGMKAGTDSQSSCVEME